MTTIHVLNGNMLPIHLPDEMIESIIPHMSLRTLCASIQSLQLFESYFLRNVGRFINEYDLHDPEYGFNPNHQDLVNHFVNIASGHWEWFEE